MQKNVLIKTKGLSKTFTSYKTDFQAIKDMNFEIMEKDFTVIMGSSGSGKSTLLYLLSGLDKITSGEIHFGQVRVDTLSEKKWAIFRRNKIGFVYQGINLVPSLSLFENIVLPGYLVEKSKVKVENTALGLIDEMDISEQMHRLPSQVSGGQQQRAAVARAFINNPEVLFADEPTGSLNSTHGRQVLDVFTNINEKGQSIVMVTHDLKAACRANRILFIKDGELNGELQMEKYAPRNEEEREKKIFAWLSEKGW
jgi:putative ABC transport system ATP-binding protein